MTEDATKHAILIERKINKRADRRNMIITKWGFCFVIKRE